MAATENGTIAKRNHRRYCKTSVMLRTAPAAANVRRIGRSDVCMSTVAQSIRAVMRLVSVRNDVTAMKTHAKVTTLGRGCFGPLLAESVLTRADYAV